MSSGKESGKIILVKEMDYDVGWACMGAAYQSFLKEAGTNRLKEETDTAWKEGIFYVVHEKPV